MHLKHCNLNSDYSHHGSECVKIAYCEILAICDGGCGHGTCKSPGECSCESGYEGNNCETGEFFIRPKYV